jgi:hypothetical protein
MDMNSLTFDRKMFYRILVWAVVLNTIWMVVSPKLEQLREMDRGFVTGLGFLLIYGLPFYIAVPRDRRKIELLIVLTFPVLLIFFISSFVIVPLFLTPETTLKLIFAFVCSSLFSAVCLTLIINRIHRIFFLKLTMFLAFISGISVVALISLIGWDAFDNIYFKTFSVSVSFASWQILTTMAIALGISISKPSSQQNAISHGGMDDI